MSSTDSADRSEKKVVAVTKHGQATIPKQFREQLGIDAPGKVLFRATEDGEVVVEQVRSPSEMRGFAARSDATTDEPATALLHEQRARDLEERETERAGEE